MVLLEQVKVVEQAVRVVSRRGFPRLAGIEFDSLVLAFAGHFDNHKTDEKYSQ